MDTVSATIGSKPSCGINVCPHSLTLNFLFVSIYFECFCVLDVYFTVTQIKTKMCKTRRSYNHYITFLILSDAAICRAYVVSLGRPTAMARVQAVMAAALQVAFC